MEFTETVAIFSAIIFVGYVIKGLTGFAGALFAVPILSLFFDIKYVVPIVSIIDMLSGGMLIPSARKSIHKQEFGYCLFGAIIGTILGTYFLHTFANDLLKTIFGVLVIIFAVRMLLEEYIRFPKVRSFYGTFFGMFGGITGGMFSVNGPPITLYLGNQLTNKHLLRGTLIAILLVDATWRNSLYVYSGILQTEMIPLLLAMIPVLLLASFIGTRMHTSITEKNYRRSISGILIISGGMLLG